MASVFIEDFESGPAGAAIDATNTGFTGFLGDPAEFSDAHSVDGTLCGDFSAAGALCEARINPGDPALYFRRFYLWLDSYPAANSFIISLTGAGAQRGDTRIEPDGRLTVRNNYTKVWTSATPLPLGAWFRVEFKWDAVGLVQACMLFTGTNLHGDIADDDSGDVTYDTGTFDALWIGNTTSNTLPLFIDAVADDDADWPGPLETDTGEPPVDPPEGIVFTEDFEGGTDGAAVDVFNSAFTEFLGGAAEFSAFQPVSGSLCADCSTTTAEYVWLKLTLPTPPELYFRRFYFRLTALPSQFFISSLNLSGAQRADLRMSGTGILAVRDVWTAKWSSETPVQIGDWNRLEWGIDIANTRQQVRLFLGDNVHGSDPSQTSGWVDYTAGQWDDINLGCTTNIANLGLQIDAVMDSDADWVGPLAGTTPPFDAVRWLITGEGLVPLRRELIV